MNYLILVDTKFPYRTGEAFLESEIRETANRFDKILIFPVDAVQGDEQTRQIEAENVQAYLFENKVAKYRKIKSGIYSLFSIWKGFGPIKHRFLDAMFENTAKAQANKIIHTLEGFPFEKNDNIYLYSYWLYIPARIVLEIAEYFGNKGINTTKVSRAHRFDIYEENSHRGYLPQRKKLFDGFDQIFTCSFDGADYLKKKYPENSGKIKVGLLGTYDHGYGAISQSEKFCIVSCSRVTPIKRVELIAEALAQLEKRGYAVDWTHIGDGPSMSILRKYLSDLCSTRVNLMGAIPNTEVYQYYRSHQANIFINTSSSEGLPVSIMEAISFGIPVIATDVGGTREIVVDGKSGKLLSKDFRPSELAECIEECLKMDQRDYYELRKNTRKFWEDNFKAKTNYTKFVDSLTEYDEKR